MIIKIMINPLQVYGLNFSARLHVDIITDVYSKQLKFIKF